MSIQTNSYKNFAYYYDKLIDSDFYCYYLNKINNLGEFNNILDMACGVGRLCFMLKNNKNNVTGLDNSSEMLMIAQSVNFNEKKGVEFINQDLRELCLIKDNYDLVTCTLDSLNYLESEYLDEIIKNVSNSLKVGGYFCFDLLTQFYIDEIVNDYYQCEEIEDFEYVWQVNKIDDHIIRHQLKILCDDATYEEIHWQFIHDFSFIEQLLKANNLEIVEKEELVNSLNDKKASRVCYVVKKGEVI